MSAAATLAPVPRRRAALIAALVGQRPASLEAQRDATDCVLVDGAWMTLWYDPLHAVASECGRMTAFRAITTTGDLMWYVACDGAGAVYHAHCTDPFEAIQHARVALGTSLTPDRRGAQIAHLASALRWGDIAFDITRADARGTARQPVGFRAAMALAALLGRHGISGRTAGFLALIEPRTGDIIHAAAQRTRALRRATSARRRKPVGFEAIC